MSALWIPIVLIAGALGRRIAGGVLNQWTGKAGGVADRVMGDTPARLIWGVMAAIAAWLGGAPLWQTALMIVAVWTGSTTGNFESMAMGRGTHSFAHDFAGMSAHAALSFPMPVLVAMLPALHQVTIGTGWAALLHGVGWTAFTNGPHWWWIVAFTMLAAPLYALGWALAFRFGTRGPIPGSPPALRLLNGFNGGSEMGEAFWGAAMNLGIFLAYRAA